MDPASSPALSAFFAAYCRCLPVNAGFLGVRGYDHMLPDFSDNGIADTISQAESIRSSLSDDSIDERLARRFLAIRIREFVSGHFHRNNPALYTGEAVFGFLTARQRLPAIPAFLAQAQANVRSAPLEWTRRALQECQAALTILSRIPESGDAQTAFQEFADYLGRELLVNPGDQYGCGAELFDFLIREGHLMADSTEAFLRFAEDELRAHSDAVLPPDEPTIHDLGEHQRCWDECRGFVAEHGLFTWPDFPLVFRRSPELVRGATQDLYYLAYRAPAAWNPVLPHPCEVNPCGPVTLKLNHIVHHAGPGHHVQNFYAARAPSLVGRIAAVDCASRIAMFCGGTMAEGWACYATDLMEEFGFLDSRERMHQEHTRLRMAARAVVDIKLHRLQMTFAEAVAFYRSRAGMSEAAATREAVRNSMFPGTAMMYLLGTSTIHRLRRQLQSRLALREFHDRFLAYGSLPVTLIAERMLAESPAGGVPGE
jgi:hypothetical protein